MIDAIEVVLFMEASISGYLEYFSLQAPKGEEGMYLGFSHLHSFLSSIFGFGLAGIPVSYTHLWLPLSLCHSLHFPLRSSHWPTMVVHTCFFHPGTVSYTHLDVYKRQTQVVINPTPVITCPATNAEVEVALLKMQIPPIIVMMAAR